ncbi:MAG: protein kinase, partial [Chloroflexi bacterium]|nr:protein kinase [Chloroflexota bacterium]
FIEYRGKDAQTNKPVMAAAVKPKIVPAADFLSRFEPLTKTIARVESSYVVKVLDFGEVEGQAVIVRESVEGKTLASMIAGGNGLPLDLALDIARQLGKYLDALHKHGVIQEVFDPEDVMLSAESEIRVLNLGLAQGLNVGELLSKGKLKAAAYHAPELLRGEQGDTRTDFYSLGAVLFIALTGKALDAKALAGKTPTLTDLYPSRLRPGLPPELDDLIAKCLHPDPARRIQSAAEFLDGVEEVRSGMAVGAGDTILGIEDSLVGQTLGAYRLVERLGQGGMATVYKAYEPALGRYVAVKVLPQFFARDPNFLKRFRREAKAVAQLSHPNIVPIHSYGEEGGVIYIAMQFVEGGTLKHGRDRVFSAEEALRLLLPVTRALGYAHARGIVHRDIKPSNVLLSEGNWPVLADFGLAQMAEASAKLTGTGVGMGTPAYMSPEQGQGAKVDARTDIYSLGIMLYEMVTGEVPFHADTPMAIVIKHLTAPMPIPRKVNPDVPKEVEELILKATAKNPDDRYPSAEEMVTAMEKTLAKLTAPNEKQARRTRAEKVEETPSEGKIPVEQPAFRFKPVHFIAIGVMLLAFLGWMFGPRLLAGMGTQAIPTAPATVRSATATALHLTIAPSPTPTAIPLSWARLNSGQEFARDEITAIAIDPKDTDVIYVGTQHAGIYKSIDGGISWRPAHNGFEDAHIHTIVIDPNDTRIVYAGVTSNRVYKTTNGGQDWQIASNGIHDYDNWENGRLLMSTVDSSTLYLTSSVGIYKTTNGGDIWSQIYFPCGQGLAEMIINPANPDILIAGFYEGSACSAGLYISDDAGSTWELLRAFPEDRPLYLSIDNLNGDYIYSIHINGKVYTSSNGGQDWSGQSLNCEVIAVHPEDGKTAFCGTGDGEIYLTKNAGEDWEFLAAPQIGPIKTISFSPDDPDKMFAGGNGLAYSTDGGLTWEPRSNGLGSALITLKIHPDTHAFFVHQMTNSQGQGIYSNIDVYRSDDNGANWQLFQENCMIDFAPLGKLYCWSWDPLASDDDGVSWQAVNTPGTGNAYADPYRPNEIYSIASWDGGIAFSSDGAITWETVAENIGESLSVFFFAPDQSRIYAIPTHPGFLYTSTDGIEWAQCGQVSEWLSQIDSRAVIDPRDGQRIFVATRGAGVDLSENGCSSWAQVNNGLGSLFVNTLAIDPNNPDTLYASTDGGAYVSFDGGQNWSQINDGLLGATVVYSIVVDPQSNVYAATPYGIFKLESSAKTITPENTPPPTTTAGPIPFASPGAGGIPADPCYSLGFKADMTVPDGTIMTPAQTFDKVWLVENTGTCTWEVGFKFVFVGGEEMGGETLTLSEEVTSGSQISLSIPMTAPTKTGTFIGAWNMYTDKGEYFLERVIFVNIKVEGN